MRKVLRTRDLLITKGKGRGKETDEIYIRGWLNFSLVFAGPVRRRDEARKMCGEERGGGLRPSAVSDGKGA